MKYEIPERPSIIRDGHSKALLLRDNSALVQDHIRRTKRAQLEQQEARINKIEEQMNNIDAKMDRILELLNDRN